MSEKNRKLIPGVIVEMGGTEYTIPPLNFSAIKKLSSKLATLKDMGEGLPDDEQIDTMIEIIHLAVKRNYPDVTVDEVADMLDMSNAMQAVGAIMSGSGFKAAGE